ncbi:MAG TPA: hypothetical protein VGI12_13130 [Vicinamibacterales bacterium]
MASGAVAARAQAPADVALYRLFLRDGSTIVSYGEYARAGDRVIVSLPLGGGAAASDVQLLSLPASAIDWDKTDAYAESVRAKRYAETQGANDYALLTDAVTRALNDIALAPDPQSKITMAIEARQNVTKWAAEHYGYRAADVGRLAVLFDGAIADARGVPNYDLTLVAGVAEPPSAPLLPAPTQEETLQQAIRAASLAPDAADRTSLLASIQQALGGIEGHPNWTAPLVARVDRALAVERQADHAYSTLIHGTLAQAGRYARTANVRGVEDLMQRILREDDRLGQRRPNEMASALAALDAQLDSARRLRLAQDSFAARVAVIQAYQRGIAGALAVMRTSRSALDDIRLLAGPARIHLVSLSARTSTALRQLAATPVPPEAAAAHEMLRNAVTLALEAADRRLKAIASGNMQQAWQASSAAAGAMLLFDRAADQLARLASTRAPAAS